MVKTKEQEKAFRLGYVEAWADAKLVALSHSYGEMSTFLREKLRPWQEEENPSIGECPPLLGRKED